MNWRRVDQYYWQSDCDYRIAKAKIDGVVKYTSFYRRELGETFTELADASAWCDNHARLNHAA